MKRLSHSPGHISRYACKGKQSELVLHADVRKCIFSQVTSRRKNNNESFNVQAWRISKYKTRYDGFHTRAKATATRLINTDMPLYHL